MSESIQRNISRKEALKRVGYLLGGAVSAPVAMGFLKGVKAQPGIIWKPQFFTEAQAKTVSIVCDIIMPETDTPAASALGVPKYVEDMVSMVWHPSDREDFIRGLEFFRERALDDLRMDFNDASNTMKNAFVNKRHRQVFGGQIDWSQRPFIWRIKELTITGYCTTEVGATRLLQYEPIPGGYRPCIGLEEAGGKTWAT